MLTAGALYQLMDDGAMLPGTNTLLTLDTLLKDALPNIANGTPDPNWISITVRNLLEMTSGVTFSIIGTDPSVSSILPITALQMAEFLYRQKLSNMPGDTTQASYSNAGFMLLGLIVARIRGAGDYLTGLSTFLNRLSITRVRSAVSVATAQPGDEARYHPRPLVTSPSVMVTGQPLCTLGYGDYNIENLGGGGGLSAAATDVARVAAALSATFKESHDEQYDDPDLAARMRKTQPPRCLDRFPGAFTASTACMWMPARSSSSERKAEVFRPVTTGCTSKSAVSRP